MYLPTNRTLWVCLIGMFLFWGKLSAQVITGSEAAKLIPDAELIWQNEDNGSLKFVRFSDQSCITKAQGESWMLETLNHRSKDAHKQYEVREDAFGMVHHRYRQYYEGVPVLNGVFYLHYKGNTLYAANGEHYPNIEISSSPSVPEVVALAEAKANLPAKAFGWDRGPQGAEDPKGELFVMADEQGTYHLAYRFDLKVASPFGRYYVFVDAHTGEFLQKYDRIHTAESEGTAETKYRGTRQMKTDSTAPSNFRLRDYTRGTGVETYDLNTGTNYNAAVDFTDTDNYWDVVLNQDDAAYDCHWGTQWTYDYFLNEHGLNSYDGNGAILQSYVHYGFNFLNAFWNGSVMTYGDGDGGGATALTSIDIVAHELTHGITEYSAGLIYMNESGALNESFSDIFGVVLDFYTDSTAANWLMGDEIGFTFRNASDPNQFSHPDTYLGNFWYSGPFDNGGVHTNSGVQNFWFYLLSEGGVGSNDNGDAYIVPAIGMAKAADIAFRNLTVYLTPSSQHSDARFFAIQSASDLFGNCSDELIATTNAWHAVGVGQPFGDAVVAGFAPSQTFACVTPASISFINNSLNGTSYQWDFGDGGTSNLATPTHTYTAPGTYTVSLITNGVALCGNTDTLVETNLITVSNVGGPLAANCTPPSISGGSSGAGIYNFTFNGINHTTGNGSDGYQDYTCSHQTTVTEGLAYPVSITTGPTITEDVKIWIDLNNDGVFANAELVFTSDNVLQTHTGTIIIPGGGTYNTILRMRVGSDESSQSLQVCSSPQFGQFEDYSITLQANTLPPSVDFVGSPLTINPGQSVSFTDLSLNVPTGWEWEFPGGTPATSTLQNPTVSYATIGTYPVTLKATNGFGADSLTKTAYINVSNTFTMCVDNVSTGLGGIFYDSGGPNGNYSNGENCTFLIEPGCADQITLTFTQFSLESGFDFLSVYDGTNAGGTLLFFGSGSTIPPPLTASSGAMFIQFTSDGSVIFPGWEANWSSTIIANNPPVAGFTVPAGPLPSNAPILFTDQTTNNPVSWLWDFGDGSSSTDQSPTHSYSAGGTYTVTMIADNCIAQDTISQTVTIAGTPSVTIIPDSIYVTLTECNDSTTETIMIINGGPGPLVYDITTTGAAASGNSLLFDDFEDNDISDWINLGGLTASPTTTNPAQGSFALETNGVGSFYQGLTRSFGPDTVSEISFWVKPTVNTEAHAYVVIGDDNIGNNNGIIFQYFHWTGEIVLFTGTQVSNVPYTPNQWYFFEFKNINFTTKTYDYYIDGVLVEPNFPFRSQTSTNISQVHLFNFQDPSIAYYDQISIGSVSQGSDWVTVAPDSGLVMPGDTAFITVTINGDGFPSGIYQTGIEIMTNDPTQPLVIIPTTMEITAPAELTLSDTCMDFGTTQQYIAVTDSVVLGNTGCDTLEIDLSSTHPAFIPSDSSIVILPGDSFTLYVDFFPDTVGNYQGLLDLVTNADDSTICLSGIATGSPLIDADPDSLSASAVCGDSVSLTLTLYNIGSGMLDINPIEVGDVSGGDSSVLLIQNFPAWGMDMDTFLQNNYGISPTVISDFQIPTTNFDDYDLIITVGDQSNFYYTSLTQALPQFEAYLNNGGVVQYQNASQGGITTIPGGVVINYPIFDNFNDNLLPSHPIMAGMPTSLQGNSASHNWLTNLPPTAEILTQTTTTQDPTTAVYPFGNGTVIATGMTWEHMYQFNWIPGGMLFNSIDFALGSQTQPADWITIAPDSGMVPAGDSLVVTVTLQSSGLQAGTYTTTILVYSNDPLNPVLEIPVTFTISGDAAMSFSDNCIDFPNVVQFQTVSDSVWLTNTGCDTLDFTPFIQPTSPFSTAGGSQSLAPGDSVALVVDFTPQTIGTFSDSLQVLSNIGIETVCLTAFSIGAPAISALPNPIFATGGTCVDSIIVPFTLYNSGAGGLVFDVEAGTSPFDSTSTQFFTFSGQRTDHLFSGLSPSVDSAMLIITVNGDFNSSIEFADILLDNTLIGSVATGTQLFGVDLVDTFLLGGNDWVTAVANGEVEIGIQNSPSVDLGGTNLHQARLIVDGAEWVYTNPDQGFVPAGDSLDMEAIFDVSGLSPGIYYASIIVNSNDPINNPYVIPCTLEVTDGPILALGDPGCVDFGNVTIGQPVSQTLMLYNTGCSFLGIPFMGTTNGVYTVSPTNLVIPEGDSAAVTITFDPTTFGPVNADLFISSLAGDTTVCLTGEGGGAPSAGIIDTSLTVILPGCVEDHVEYMNLTNLGGGALTYAVMPSPLPWISVPAPTGSIQAGDTADIAMVYNYSGLTPDTFEVDMTVNTGDPATPQVIFHITVIVEPNGPAPLINYSGLLNAGEILSFSTPSIPAGGYAVWDFGDGNPVQAPSYNYSFANAGLYPVILAVYDSTGCGVANELLLDIDFPVGIQEGLGFRGFKLFPNPNQGAFWVEYRAQEAEVRMEITNPLGQLIQQELLTQADVRHHAIQLPKGTATGTYTVRIFDGADQVIGRIYVKD